MRSPETVGPSSRGRVGPHWRAAILLGLISSTFSTLVSQFTAGRLGRDALVDWMTVATIPIRDVALSPEPTAVAIAAGILFHQWADFSWEVFFFGLLGRWTALLRPWTLVLLALPWALFTSAMEWLVLVPLFPFRQAIFPLEQPYWIGALVHLTSAFLYPLFPAIRDRLAGWHDAADLRFARAWAAVAALVLAATGALDLAGAFHHEWPGHRGDWATDATYMRRMSAHHRQGIDLADLAAARAQDPHLRALARLMSAEQRADIGIFDLWSDSWSGAPPGLCTAEERAAMPGMLSEAEVQALRDAPAEGFDPLFVTLMSRHHAGAVQMADAELASGSDPRLRVMAHAIRHAQQGEIDLMHGVDGRAAVAAALANMIAARPDICPACR